MARSATRVKHLTVAAILIALFLLPGRSADAQKLDVLSLEGWAKLREVERYQMKIAEKYYLEKNYKVAASEYEKFLSLYESSEGAPYSLLKWSLCLIEQKKPNTAISEGFQSIIDYWPDSPEAIASAFYIARAYKDMGEVRKANKAFKEVVSKHGDHLVAVYSLVDLADLASIDKDEDEQVAAYERVKEFLREGFAGTGGLELHCREGGRRRQSSGDFVSGRRSANSSS
jgi:tetratricopeptide (TPR) repeat protein